MNQEDIPLTTQFQNNPLEYMQNYVRNLNNQVFLSEFHINNLYALLLIGRNSPWDDVKVNMDTIKQLMEVVVDNKVSQVKTILEALSNVYQEKVKKSALSQIQKLMGILKAKRKSIYIEKDKNLFDLKKLELIHQLTKQREKKDIDQEDVKDNEGVKENNYDQQDEGNEHEGNLLREHEDHHEDVIPEQMNKKHLQQHKEHKEHHNQKHQHPDNQQQIKGQCCMWGQNKQQTNPTQQKKDDNSKQVFSIFYGLANLSNLTSSALKNIIEYSSTNRYIKFKMSDHYIMTIHNNDPYHFDLNSTLKKVPADAFVHHIFPFLTASQLFGVRGVCKQWYQNVKESWHSTFKRDMFIQMLACQFCKDIQFYYKIIQLRNPFFQKLSLLIHALIEIIQWQNVDTALLNNTISLQLKRILIIMLKVVGDQSIQLTNINAITQQYFNQHKSKLSNLKQRISVFFNNLAGTQMSINQLRNIKINFLDNPFMRVDELNNDDKTPLLLTILVKQMTLQQILRNHIFLAQEYLMKTKKKLDNISKKIAPQRGYLQTVYKILLLRSSLEPPQQNEPSEMPNFHEMLQSIFLNKGSSNKPDFSIKTATTITNIFLDGATKLDIILSTFKNLEINKSKQAEQQTIQQQNKQIEQGQSNNFKEGGHLQEKKITPGVINLKIENNKENNQHVEQSQKQKQDSQEKKGFN